MIATWNAFTKYLAQNGPPGDGRYCFQQGCFFILSVICGLMCLKNSLFRVRWKWNLEVPGSEGRGLTVRGSELGVRKVGFCWCFVISMALFLPSLCFPTCQMYMLAKMTLKDFFQLRQATSSDACFLSRTLHSPGAATFPKGPDSVFSKVSQAYPRVSVTSAPSMLRAQWLAQGAWSTWAGWMNERHWVSGPCGPWLLGRFCFLQCKYLEYDHAYSFWQEWITYSWSWPWT